jgi:dihydrofolate reductase
MVQRPVILFIATSIDGFIARKNGDIDWLFTDQDYGYREFFSCVDTVVMGRKTYAASLAFGEYPYPGRISYVFSRTRKGQQDDNARFVAPDPAEFIAGLKSKPGKHIWLVGGSELIQSFVQCDLIDEYVISVHPVILGSGIPLFRSPLPTQKLIYRDCTSFDTGLVQMTYSRRR